MALLGSVGVGLALLEEKWPMETGFEVLYILKPHQISQTTSFFLQVNM